MDPGGVDPAAAWICADDLDPLYVEPLEWAMDDLERSGAHGALEIAPDEHLKYRIGGSGSYWVEVPNAPADAPLRDEWHPTTFVGYLRLCFRWGGFPGLECKARRPGEEVAYFTDGLLPI
jgi:hypothetical protein